MEITDGVYRARTAASSPTEPEEEMGEDDLSDRGKGRDGGMKEQATQLDGCRRRRGEGRVEGEGVMCCYVRADHTK